MSRLPPLNIAELDPELQAVMSVTEEMMGFTPNDGLIMARHPALLKAVLALVQAVYQSGSVPIALKKMVALMTSSASGCQYCEAHTRYGSLQAGVSAQKIAAIWQYPTSDLFTDAERIALDVARNAALVPNAVSDSQFNELRNYFSDEQIVELLGVISLFGFLNRWNSSLVTALESTLKTKLSALNMSD